MDTKLLTVTAAARRKDCSRGAIYRALERGELTALDLEGEKGQAILANEQFANWQPNMTGLRASKEHGPDGE